MEKSREELQKEHDEAMTKREQYRHRCQRLENRIRYYTEGERRKRNHRLIVVLLNSTQFEMNCSRKKKAAKMA